MNPVDGKPAESAPDIVISSTPPAVQKVSNGTAGGKSAAASADTKIDTKKDDGKKKDGRLLLRTKFLTHFCCNVATVLCFSVVVWSVSIRHEYPTWLQATVLYYSVV